MKRRITVNQKEYEMQKITVDLYMEYADLAEEIGAHRIYTKQDIEAMLLFICKAYGEQFTADELKDAENGVDAAGIILEFQMIDMEIGKEITKRMEKITENFQKGK